MVKVSARVIRTRGTCAGFIQRTRVIRMTRVLDIDLPATRPRLTRATLARGQDAIHHINAACDSTDDIIGFANAH
jgi:hypothetical protein